MMLQSMVENAIKHGLGLQTIRDRLRMLHGDAGRLHIGANSPSGVIATIEVPYQLSKPDRNDRLA
jgi:LytS/YehU family sensor histidine kinase